jgi:hypothetical protein
MSRSRGDGGGGGLGGSRCLRGRLSRGSLFSRCCFRRLSGCLGRRLLRDQVCPDGINR